MVVRTVQTPQTATIEFIRIHPNYLRAKRAIDILFTLLIFIPLCITIAIVSILIRLDSEGSIFYRQKRIGQNGVEFEMLKFRSMYENCDDALHRLAIQKYMEGQKLAEDVTAGYKQIDDLRITRVGRFIRKTSIDELPQFFNVLIHHKEFHYSPSPSTYFDLYSFVRSQMHWLEFHNKVIIALEGENTEERGSRLASMV